MWLQPGWKADHSGQWTPTYRLSRSNSRLCHARLQLNQPTHLTSHYLLFTPISPSLSLVASMPHGSAPASAHGTCLLLIGRAEAVLFSDWTRSPRPRPWRWWASTICRTNLSKQTQIYKHWQKNTDKRTQTHTNTDKQTQTLAKNTDQEDLKKQTNKSYWENKCDENANNIAFCLSNCAWKLYCNQEIGWISYKLDLHQLFSDSAKEKYFQRGIFRCDSTAQIATDLSE